MCVLGTIIFSMLDLVLYLVLFLDMEFLMKKSSNPDHSEEDWETVTPLLIKGLQMDDKQWDCFELLCCFK